MLTRSHSVRTANMPIQEMVSKKHDCIAKYFRRMILLALLIMIVQMTALNILLKGITLILDMLIYFKIYSPFPWLCHIGT